MDKNEKYEEFPIEEFEGIDHISWEAKALKAFEESQQLKKDADAEANDMVNEKKKEDRKNTKDDSRL